MLVEIYMRTNVIQFLAIVASVFIVLSLLKMLSESNAPVQNAGEVQANYFPPENFADEGGEVSGYVSGEEEGAPVNPEPAKKDESDNAPSQENFTNKGNCFPKDSLTANDLLPSDDASNKWAQVNPTGKGDIKDQNFLTAGHHVGVNTVGQSLRNANRQLRSEPANPQVKVSPWLQSTIDPDVNRKALEIGGECA